MYSFTEKIVFFIKREILKIVINIAYKNINKHIIINNKYIFYNKIIN